MLSLFRNLLLVLPNTTDHTYPHGYWMTMNIHKGTVNLVLFSPSTGGQAPMIANYEPLLF